MGEAQLGDRPRILARRRAEIRRRLADIEQRLSGLREARPAPPDHSAAAAAAELLLRARQYAMDADRHRRESVANTLLVHQMVVQAFNSAARAHEHAAAANERSARAGIGDVAEYLLQAEFHRNAAKADRRRAREAQAQGANPEASTLPPATDAS